MSRSAGSRRPPEFFFDRSLGKETAKRLRTRATVHLIAEHYPNDAQDVSDEGWIARGIRRRWILLTKDKRIRYRRIELEVLGSGQLHCLSNGQLTTHEMAGCFAGAWSQIRPQRGDSTSSPCDSAASSRRLS